MKIRVKDEGQTKKFLDRIEKRKELYRNKLEQLEFEYDKDTEKGIVQGIISQLAFIEKWLRNGNDVELEEFDMSIVGSEDEDGKWLNDDSLIVMGY